MTLFFLLLLLFFGLQLTSHLFVVLPFVLFLLYKLIKKKNIKVSLLGLTFFLIGIGFSFINISYSGSGASGFVYEVKENYFLLNNKGEKLYVYTKDHSYEVGDYLEIKGEKEALDFVSIESEFDFTEYLSNKGVYRQIQPSSIKVKFSNPIKINKIKKQFIDKLDEKSQPLIKAILFSNFDDIEVIDSLRDFHLTRLISASGLYLHAFIGFFTFLFSFTFKKKHAEIIAICLSGGLLLFNITRFSIMRIYLLSILKWINNNVTKKRISSFHILCISAIVFLLIDHHLAYQDSFILGYGFSFTAYFINYALMDKKPIKKTILTSLFLYLFFIPFEVKYFNCINPLTLLVLPILTPLFVGYGILGYLTLLSGGLIAKVLSFISPLLYSLSSIGRLSNLMISSNLNNEFSVAIYFVVYYLFLYYYSFNHIYMVKRVLIGLVSIYVIHMTPITNLISAEVDFINVGQGDSCLIRYGTTSVLIDTGGSIYKDIAKDTLIPFLKKKQIYNLDLVITTHDDYDHMGALDSLQHNFYVKKYVKETTKFPIKIGNITFQNYNNYAEYASEENDKSLVIGFSLMHKDFLIMGDAPISIEKAIMNEYQSVPCDILKVGHHGSKTSSCSEFISYLSPKEAIISCGKNNKYGHPNKEVLEVLYKHNIKIRRTDVEGTICYYNYIFM